MSIENVSVTAATNPPQPEKHYFTPEEANRSLPYISRVIRDITEVYQEIVALRQRLEGPEHDAGLEELEARYETRMDQLSVLVDELHTVGVELKDFEKGLVDFPAVHEGREVWLCWRMGEDGVTHWHELDAGFSGRQPLATSA